MNGFFFSFWDIVREDASTADSGRQIEAGFGAACADLPRAVPTASRQIKQNGGACRSSGQAS